MAGDDSKSAIPAWQRAQRQPPQPSDTAPTKPHEPLHTKANETTSNVEESDLPAAAEPAALAAAEQLDNEHSSPELQLQHIQSFLDDPAVKNAPIEKKRAFFESKGIPKERVDEALKADQPSTGFKTSDFADFKQTSQTTTTTTTRPENAQLPSPSPASQATGPPIITYPEFLVEAHKPPPLITPGRLLNTAYVVSGLAAVLYGASKYLVEPMSATLSDARHELAMHSQSKIDEMNERLMTLVSKVPEKVSKPAAGGAQEETDDIESITSDPTELYHRDMGTQTSPDLSRTSSLTTAAEKEKKDPTSHATTGLTILQSHLNDMLSQSTNLETSNKEKQDSLEKLRNYLDGLTYAGQSAYGGWSYGIDGGLDSDPGKKDGKERDMVEELKKEIRGVKGVLLSAKRFPGVAGRLAVAS